MKYCFSCFFILVLCNFICKGQVYKLRYEEKTSGLVTPFSDSVATLGINVYRPFVEYRNFRDDDKIGWAVRNDGFKSVYINDTAYYHRKDSLGDSIAGFLHQKLLKKLKKLVPCQTGALSSVDSAVVIRELAKMKQILKTTEVKMLSIDDSLYKVLKKYPSDQQVFLTVTFYQTYLYYPKIDNNWGFYSFFVVDLKRRKLLFYDYKQTSSHNSSVYFNYRSQKYFIKITRAYRSYLKKNKAYLKQKSKA